MKKVSVIVTLYNSVDYVEKTIESILNQKGNGTDFELELIIVDDCSTDGTVEVLKNLKIPFLSTEQNSGGPNKGRNIGLKIATGDYICIADHDDFWFDDKITTILPFFDKASILTSGYSVIDSNTGRKYNKVKKSSSGFIYYHSNQTFLDKLQKVNNKQNTYLGSIFFNKSLKNVYFEEVFGMVDYDWILRLFHNQDSLEICKSLYKRRVSGSNLSLNEEYKIKDFHYSLYFVERYSSIYPQRVITCHKKLYGTHARYYYLTGNMKKARFLFFRSEINLKTIFYILTSYFGSTYIIKYFNIYE